MARFQVLAFECGAGDASARSKAHCSPDNRASFFGRSFRAVSGSMMSSIVAAARRAPYILATTGPRLEPLRFASTVGLLLPAVLGLRRANHATHRQSSDHARFRTLCWRSTALTRFGSGQNGFASCVASGRKVLERKHASTRAQSCLPALTKVHNKFPAQPELPCPVLLNFSQRCAAPA